jgi:hypothetical protein
MKCHKRFKDVNGGREGKGREGQEGGYCTFLHLGVGMLGRAKSQYLLGGVVVFGSTFLCRTCSSHGGGGGGGGGGAPHVPRQKLKTFCEIF